MLFKRPTACKEARVGSVSQPTLKHCADQLSSVFRDILNTSVVTCLLQQLNHAKQGKMSDFQTIITRFPEGHIPLPSAVHQQLRLEQTFRQTPEVCRWHYPFLCISVNVQGLYFYKDSTSFWLGKTKDIHNLTCIWIVWATIDCQICWQCRHGGHIMLDII